MVGYTLGNFSNEANCKLAYLWTEPWEKNLDSVVDLDLSADKPLSISFALSDPLPQRLDPLPQRLYEVFSEQPELNVQICLQVWKASVYNVSSQERLELFK